MFKFKIYESTYLDPRINLAYEEFFLSSVEEDEIIVFFWQSENAVVIGRNQNPYQECNMVHLEKDHVQLVRRLSGGGAVYHDQGNLNFSFIAPNHLYDSDKFFEYMINALLEFNIEAERSGRNDLTIGGRKFSGNAFITEDHASLHHGTLLIDADITRIQSYLTVSHKKLETKGFDSIVSRVVNLKEMNEMISKRLIIEATSKILRIDNKVEESQLPNLDKIADFTLKYNSHSWNFGENPKFNIAMEEKYSWGLVNIHMHVEDGLIKEFRLFTDSLDTCIFNTFNQRMQNQELSINIVNQIIDSSFKDFEIASDIKQLLTDKVFS